MDKQFEAILKTEYNFVFDRLREKALKENSAVQELNERFDDIRKKAMINSYFKYGPMRKNHGEYKCMDATKNILLRLDKYLTSRNTEFLADIANFAMIEYTYPSNSEARTGDSNTEVYQYTNIKESIEYLLTTYKATNNKALLIDIANIAMIEFTNPSFENASYQETFTDGCELYGFGINQLTNQ